MRNAGRWLILLAAAASFTLVVGAEAQPAGTALVLLARAPADAIPKGQAARPLARGARLNEGDRVRTGQGGAAELELGDGSIVRLGELSDLEIDQLDVDAAGAPTTSRFNLAAGQARAWVARQVVAKVAVGQGRFAVQTPTAVAAVRQTDFAMLHAADAASRIYTFAGGVEVTAVGRVASVLCTRNRWTRVLPGRDPDPCVVIPLRDKRSLLKVLAFESATVEPGDPDREAVDSLGAKLSGERLTGLRLLRPGTPTRTGRSDAASHEAPVGTSVSIE